MTFNRKPSIFSGFGGLWDTRPAGQALRRAFQLVCGPRPTPHGVVYKRENLSNLEKYRLQGL